MHAIDLDVTGRTVPPLRLVTTFLVPAGALIRLKASGVSMLAALRVTGLNVGGTSLEIVHRYARAEMERDWMWHIQTLSLIVARTIRGVPAGTVVEVAAEYAGSSGDAADRGVLFLRYSGLEWLLEVGTVPDPRSVALAAVAEPLALRFVAGSPHHIEAYLKPDGDVAWQTYDASGNPTDRGTDVPARKTATITGRVEVVDPQDRPALTNAPPRGLDGTPVWFGECHWHTDFSGDGQRRLDDALRSARDELHLDFAGPADHMGSSGRYQSRGVAEQAAICKDFDSPGRFCVVPGAELSRRYGHCNLYTQDFALLEALAARFPDDLAPAWDHDPDRYGLEALTRLCPPGRALVVPHHANMDSWVRERVVREDGRPFWCAMHFPLPAERSVVRLYEMVQTRGAFETEETDRLWRVADGGLGGSARTALLRGYRVGFVGGTDNHCGWPTRQGSKTCGLTAVHAPSLDLPGLFGALHDRRCYATSGARIVADATLNGHPMGSEIRLEPAAPRAFRISIRGTAPIDRVEIVHAGYVLARLPVIPDSLDFRAEWADERPGRPLDDAWYYVRARQTDGHCVWLSPFWVDLP